MHKFLITPEKELGSCKINMRLTLQNTISLLEKGIVKYNIGAEEQWSFALLIKANPFRKTGKSKNNVITWWFYSKLRRRIMEDFRLRDSIN